MVRYNTVLGTDTKPKFQQKKSKVKVMYFSDGALPQPVIRAATNINLTLVFCPIICTFVILEVSLYVFLCASGNRAAVKSG